MTENLHKPIALLGWIVFFAKPIWRLIEFLDDIDFFGDPNSVLIEINQDQFIGAVTFKDCMFKRCRFRNVGIIGKKDLLAEKFRKDSQVVRGK